MRLPMFDNYDYFKKEYKLFDEWNSKEDETLWEEPKRNGKQWLNSVVGYTKNDTITFGGTNDVIFHPFGQKDMVNSPAHYTRGKQEAIDIIEEAIQDAPDVKAGMLQAQALKYLLRLWLKGNAPQDASKARWYLERLITHLKDTK